MLIFALVGAGAVVTVALIGIILHLLVGNVLEVGARSFYIDNLFSVPGPGKAIKCIPFRKLWKCGEKLCSVVISLRFYGHCFL